MVAVPHKFLSKPNACCGARPESERVLPQGHLLRMNFQNADQSVIFVV